MVLQKRKRVIALPAPCFLHCCAYILLASTFCQVLGIHLGIRRLSDGGVYTPNALKVAVAAVHREDQTWTSPLDSYMIENCRKEWEAISMWK